MTQITVNGNIFPDGITCRCMSQVKFKDRLNDKKVGLEEVESGIKGLKIYDMTFDLREYPHIDRKAVQFYNEAAKKDVNWQESTQDLKLSNWTKGKGFHIYPLTAKDSIKLRSIYLTPECRSITMEFYPAGGKSSLSIKKFMKSIGFYDIEQADPRHVCSHHGGDMGIVHDHWFKEAGYINVFDISNIMEKLRKIGAFGLSNNQKKSDIIRRHGSDKTFRGDHKQKPKDVEFDKPSLVEKKITDWFMGKVG